MRSMGDEEVFMPLISTSFNYVVNVMSEFLFSKLNVGLQKKNVYFKTSGIL